MRHPSSIAGAEGWLQTTSGCSQNWHAVRSLGPASPRYRKSVDSTAVRLALVKRLIINADDFGLTRGVNRAILEAHRDGIVTSTTLMACGRGFDDAVGLAHSISQMSVGCHVTLVDGTPILDPAEVRSLMASAKASQFRKKLGRFVLAASTGRLDAAQVEAEATVQIRKLQGAGIEVSHLDTHKHTHMFAAVLTPLLRAARICGVGAIRNPFVPVRPVAREIVMRRPDLWKRSLEVQMLKSYEPQFRREVAKSGLRTPDGALGVIETGVLDEELFRALVRNLPEGTWELVCHPGYNDAELGAANTRLTESRNTELAVLKSHASRKVLEDAGVQAISYREL